MKKRTMMLLAMAVLLLPMSMVLGQSGNNGFGFNSDIISGLSGAASLTGGGSYNLDRKFLSTGGSFSCLEDITSGPLKGCLAGEGVRWDSSAILSSTSFKCNASETSTRTASTSDDTVVMQADFYRQGDGNDESFTAKMFVSAIDQDPSFPSNVWIEGVGCGDAIANF